MSLTGDAIVGGIIELQDVQGVFTSGENSSPYTIHPDPWDSPLEFSLDISADSQTARIITRLRLNSVISEALGVTVVLSVNLPEVQIVDHVYVSVQPAAHSLLNIVMMNGEQAEHIVSDLTAAGLFLNPVTNYNIELIGSVREILTVDNLGVIRRREGVTIGSLTSAIMGSFASWNDKGIISVYKIAGSVQSKVKDITVNAILINPEVRLSLTEDASVGAVVLRLGNGNPWQITSPDMGTTPFQLSDNDVTVLRYLDYDYGPRQYKFNIRFDLGVTSGASGITIDITNINDIKPEFTEISHHFTVIIGTFVGDIIGYVEAKDADSSDITYTVLDQTAAELISVNSGMIHVRHVVSSAMFGPIENRAVLVTASDGELESVIKATITISLFSMDNTAILNNLFVANVSENEPSNTHVTIISLNTYTNYKLIGTYSNMFWIDSTTGVVFTKQALDREALTNVDMDFTITAIPEGEDGCSLTVIGILRLTVLDKNDEVPVFVFPLVKTSYGGYFLENSPTGVIISSDKIVAMDKDIGVNAEIEYRLDQLADPSLFIINSVTGVIQTNSSDFDRETKDVYTFGILAVDGTTSGVRNTASALIQILIEDQNDNAPIFGSPSYQFSVPENTIFSAPVPVSATDIDLGSNAQITYGITRGGYGLISVDATTGVVEGRALDREGRSIFEIEIIAYDHGIPGQSTATNYTIIVEDVNDNKPRFVSSTYFKIAENLDCISPLGFSVSANDVDDGSNAVVEYFSASPDFTINSTTGDVYCISPLDYDSPPTVYVIEITARDKGTQPKETKINITIELTDVNDNPPVFICLGIAQTTVETEPSTPGSTQTTLGPMVLPEICSHFTVTVDMSELSVDDPVMVIDAEDIDSGENGMFTLTLKSGNASDYFTINPRNGLIRVKSDNFVPGVYTAEIAATDQGTPPLSSSSQLIITVVKNTTSPFSFTQTDYVFNIQEEVSVADSLGKLTVNNPNGDELTFSLVETSVQSAFRVDVDGNVFCDSVLDRENIASYTLVARVHAAGDSTTGDVCVLSIDVTDINDHPPVFNASIRLILHVPEDTTGGTSIVIAAATDADSGLNAMISYSTTTTSPFVVNKDTGEVVVDGGPSDKPLDREKIHQLEFTIKATDKGDPAKSSETSVVVNVMDVNDNAPVFESDSYVISVDENTQLGTTVTTVKASDADPTGDYGFVTYRMSGPDINCPLRIIDVQYSEGVFSGDIVVKHSLDREIRSEYTCQIIASDRSSNPLTSTANITILVADVNDNRPTIAQIDTNREINRDADIGTVIVSALDTDDLDLGENATVKFLLKENQDSNIHEYLLINVITGLTTLNRKLDFFGADGALITIVAYDGGKPSLSSNVTLFLDIKDGNTRPYFSRDDFRINITEETLTGGPVLTIYALDIIEKKEVICNCTYAMVIANELFNLDASTGILTQLKSLDRELYADSNGVYSFDVEATDNGAPPKTTAKPARISVYVTDVNDNAPLFDQVYTFITYQDRPVGSKVGVASANDRDETSATEYSIIDQSEDGMFSIDSSSSELTVASSLLKDSPQEYSIQVTVRATDTMKVTYWSTTVVTVRILYADPNEHAPKFPKVIYQTTIPSDSPVGTQLELNNYPAIDTDIGPDGMISYSIDPATNYRDTFAINNQTADISLDLDLSVVDLNHFRVTVIARDSGVVPKSGSATVIIKLLGEKAIPCEGVISSLKSETELKETYYGAFLALLALSVVGILSTVVILAKCLRLRSTLRALKDSDNASFVSGKSAGKDTYKSNNDRPWYNGPTMALAGNKLGDGYLHSVPSFQGPRRNEYLYPKPSERYTPLDLQGSRRNEYLYPKPSERYKPLDITGRRSSYGKPGTNDYDEPDPDYDMDEDVFQHPLGYRPTLPRRPQ